MRYVYPSCLMGFAKYDDKCDCDQFLVAKLCLN